MLQRNHLSKIAAVALIIFGLSACGDNGGVEPPPQPTVPDLSKVKPDTEYFENNYPAGDPHNAIVDHTYENFNTAAPIATGAVAFLFFSEIGNGFLEIAKNENAEFKDGKWVWEYTASQGGQTVTVKLTAEVRESSNDVKWELFFSSSGNGEFDYENYKFMEGTVANDGSSGTWKFFDFDPNDSTSSAVLESSWTINGDNDKTFTFDYNDPENNDNLTIRFVEDGVDNTLTMTSSDGTTDITVYWNSDTQAGYYIEDGTQYCWDSNLQNTACS